MLVTLARLMGLNLRGTRSFGFPPGVVDSEQRLFFSLLSSPPFNPRAFLSAATPFFPPPKSRTAFFFLPYLSFACSSSFPYGLRTLTLFMVAMTFLFNGFPCGVLVLLRPSDTISLLALWSDLSLHLPPLQFGKNFIVYFLQVPFRIGIFVL